MTHFSTHGCVCGGVLVTAAAANIFRIKFNHAVCQPSSGVACNLCFFYTLQSHSVLCFFILLLQLSFLWTCIWVKGNFFHAISFCESSSGLQVTWGCNCQEQGTSLTVRLQRYCWNKVVWPPHIWWWLSKKQRVELVCHEGVTGQRCNQLKKAIKCESLVQSLMTGACGTLKNKLDRLSEQ